MVLEAVLGVGFFVGWKRLLPLLTKGMRKAAFSIRETEENNG